MMTLLSPAAASRSDLTLSAGSTYYVCVRACNSVELCSESCSDGATLDTTPTISGRVWDGLLGGDVQVQASP